MFQQVPTVEIDGMKLVQTRAIPNYIASKYNLYGKDMKERALYNEVPVLKNRYHKKVIRLLLSITVVGRSQPASGWTFALISKWETPVEREQ
jgi:glutathione S-transferase